MAIGEGTPTETVPVEETTGGIASDIAVPEIRPAVVAPSDNGEFNTFRLTLDLVACWRLDDIRFEFDSSFIRPEAADEFHTLAELCSEHPEAPLSLFGHADPVGNDEYNKRLSGRRAMAVYGMLIRDSAMWEKLYKDSEDNWGLKSIQLMLKAVGHDPVNVDGVESEQTTQAIKAFQNTNGLETDGIAGPITREKLMSAYMDVTCTDAGGTAFKLEKSDFLAQGADAKGKGDYQGCSEFNPLLMFSKSENDTLSQSSQHAKRNQENAPNRRVVVLLFRPGSKVDPAKWPCPRVNEGISGCKKRFFSDANVRRQFQANRREFETTHDTFACRFYQRIRKLSPCDRVVPPPLVIRPEPVISITKIQTTDPEDDAKWLDDDDFSPRLDEKAKIFINITNLPSGFSGTLRVDIGRLSNRADNAATADVNESFTLVSRLEPAVNADGSDPFSVEVEWDGKATQNVAQEFSDRQTPNVNSGANVNIPLNSINSGQPVTHGLYVIDKITLRQGGRDLAVLRPANVDMSVPIIANLIFNGNWLGDLRAFGLEPFQDQIEDALRRFGGRDYMIRDATLTNRINVRFVTEAGINNAHSMRISIGGSSPPSLAGNTPNGPAPLADNIYSFHDGLSADITVFPTTFMLFNSHNVGPNDVATFQNIFQPLGVTAARTAAAPGTATARAVAGGVVTGRCTSDDADNVTLTLDNDGIPTVVSSNPAIVPATRATQIQAALRAFVRMVGNTINHELAHGLGIASRVLASNRITIGGTTVTSPLDGDGGAHNKAPSPGNIVDAGSQRTFVRRIESTGVQNRFNATNMRYLRDCIPFDRNNN
jgi:hypothetical protein